MSNQQFSNRRQSIIMGGLISSAGLFFAKFIGIFYVIPFNNILGGSNSENLTYYGVAFTLYSYLLNIATAGFPFAIATLIAKYTSANDYRTALLIKRISSGLILSLGFVMMILLIVFSTPLAKLLIAENGNNIATMRLVLIIIAFALFFVPFLSSIRGFYQGLKHMEVYAFSQVLEQIARVSFLLIVSSFFVYVLHFDRVWAVYIGVLSTSIAAIIAYLHMKKYDRKHQQELIRLANEQSYQGTIDNKSIMKELIFIAIPFFLVSLLGYSDMLVNTMFLKEGLEAFGNTTKEINSISGIINLNIQKLIAIPMILAPGFSGAIIPHITSAITKKKHALVKKSIQECVDIVMYIALPICFCLFLFAKPIYNLMFNPADSKTLILCAQILSWFSIEAFFCTIAPVFTSLLMASRMRKVAIRNLFVCAILKIGSAYFFLATFGYPGLIFSTMLSYITLLVLDIFVLRKVHKIRWIYSLRKILIMTVALLGMYICTQILANIGMNQMQANKVTQMIQLAFSGIFVLSVYFIITYFFQLPQLLLHFDLKKIIAKWRKANEA